MSNTCAVAMTTYCGEEFLAEQLDSLVNQTRRPDRIYVYDDRSKDQTVSIVESYIQKYPEINWDLKVNETNKGWKENFRSLLNDVKEDLIFLCDQDDIWCPTKIERMAGEMDNNPNIDLLACGYNPLYMDNDSTISDRILHFMDTTESIQQIPFDCHFMYVMRPGCTFAVRREFIDSVNDYWGRELPHDAVIWRYALLRGSAYYLNVPLISWRRYRKSSSSKFNTNEDAKDEYRIRYEYTVGSVKSRLKYLESMNMYVQDHGTDKRKQQIIDGQNKFENAYERALTAKSPFKMLCVGIRYHSYFLTVKSMIADIIMMTRCH